MAVAIIALLVMLALTILIEIFCAALFGYEKKVLAAVATVNLVTNLPVGLFVLTLFGLSVGISEPFVKIPGRPGSGGEFQIVIASWVWITLGALEVFTVIAEWRLLLWALAGSVDGRWKLLAMTVAMNAASAIPALLAPRVLSGMLLTAAFGGLPFLVIVACVFVVVIVVQRRGRRAPTWDEGE